MKALSNISILEDSSVASKLSFNSGDRSSSNFVDADFIMHYVVPVDRLSIGSLIIRAAAHSVLTNIKASWPGLTTFNSSTDNTQDKINSNYYQSQASTVFESTNKIDIGSRTLPRNSINSVNAAASSSNKLWTNDTSTKFTATSLGSPSQLRNRQSSVGNKQTVTSNDPIDLMNDANTKLTSLQLLLAPSAVAHTQLIQRLSGLCDDLQTLSSINLKAGAVNEAQRLM
jgi:hypothetical protein